jgi:hypothetical protein
MTFRRKKSARVVSIRSVFSFLLLGSLLYQCLGTLGVWAWASLHKQDRLEACVNQDLPELACEGQCVLMQKLKALDPESSTAEESLRTAEMPYFIVPQPLDLPVEILFTDKQVRVFHRIQIPHWTFEILTPPPCFV